MSNKSFKFSTYLAAGFTLASLLIFSGCGNNSGLSIGSVSPAADTDTDTDTDTDVIYTSDTFAGTGITILGAFSGDTNRTSSAALGGNPVTWMNPAGVGADWSIMSDALSSAWGTNNNRLLVNPSTTGCTIRATIKTLPASGGYMSIEFRSSSSNQTSWSYGYGNNAFGGDVNGIHLVGYEDDDGEGPGTSTTMVQVLPGGTPPINGYNTGVGAGFVMEVVYTASSIVAKLYDATGAVVDTLTSSSAVGATNTLVGLGANDTTAAWDDVVIKNCSN